MQWRIFIEEGAFFYQQLFVSQKEIISLDKVVGYEEVYFLWYKGV
jgi:hypothetical protein